VKVNLSIPKYVFLGALVAALLLGGSVSPTMAKGDKVLAKVGNQTITEADLQALASAVPERLRYLYLTPEGRQQTLDYIINVYAMAAEAQKEGLDKDPKFRKVLAFTQKDLLARKYLEKTAKGVANPTEKEARAFFDKNAELYGTPESVHLRHVLVNSEKEAKDVLKKLKKGAKFSDLASKVSTCPTKAVGGDLDWLPRGRLVKELEDVAFNMKKGQVTGPVKTRFGYHVLLLEDKRPARKSSFDEVKDYILEQLKFQKQQDHYQKVAKALRKKMNVQVMIPKPTTPQAKPGAAAAAPPVKAVGTAGPTAAPKR
jgi:peptidyl-prolyl cis-trans isomerase C